MDQFQCETNRRVKSRGWRQLPKQTIPKTEADPGLPTGSESPLGRGKPFVLS